MNKKMIKLLSVMLALCLIAVSLPAGSFAAEREKGKLRLGVLTDVHYYAQENIDDLDACQRACESTMSTSHLSDGILDCALDVYEKKAAADGLDYLFISGDLTRNGDIVSARKLAEKLEAFEERTGVPVIVTNGNHDINNKNADLFRNGRFEKTAEKISPQAFREIFKDLGWDLAVEEFTPAAGKTAGCLSYVAQLKNGYRLIVMDGGMYSADNTYAAKNVGETGGRLTKDALAWCVEQTRDAVEDGETPLGMTHWSIVPHFTKEIAPFKDFCMVDFDRVSERLADAGMRYVFTGHIHLQDIASHVSDLGNIIYDVCTSSTINFPNYIRTVELDNSGDDTLDFSCETHDFDETKPLEWNGVTYDRPFKYKGFGINFTGDDAYTMVMNLLKYQLEFGILKDVVDNGGLYEFLTGAFDLEGMIDGLLGGGVSLGKLTIFSSKNVMSLIKDLCDQIDKAYLSDPDRLLDILGGVLRPIVEFKVSDVPCTRFIDTYGFGSPDRGGNLGEAVASTLVYFYSGEQDISEDAFMTDFVKRLDTGEVSTELLDVLLDQLLDSFIQNELFGTLRLNLSAAFPKGTFGHILVKTLDLGLKAMLFGNNTFKNIVKIGFGLLHAFRIIPYASINDILYHVMDEYLTPSQMEEVDGEIQSFIVSLSIDDEPSTYSAPGVFTDLEASFAAKLDGGYEVEATADNLRLPALVSNTFGNSASNRRNISWFTKATVTGSDYCLTEKSAYEAGGFTPVNTAPAGVTVSVDTREVTRQYPGIDLGVAGFFNYTFALQRHMLTISGLKPGTTYYYKIGDAEKGFWSETAKIKTAGDSNSVTFFHVADPQCGLEKQYGTFSGVLDTAYSLFPNAAFMICTGDHVDHGDNFKQWKWMFASARDKIMNTALMPTAGNHEGKGTKAINNYFTLPYYADQNTEDGVFYSFDYNNTHFIVLNTENLGDDDALSDEQIEWLKKDAGGSTAQWKILSLHKALYSNGSHYDDDDVVAIRKQLCSLLPELGIDVVLQGHDHVYLRTAAMNSNKVVKVYETTETYDGREYKATVNPDGTYYCITACSGVKYYKSKPAKETDKLFPRAEAIVDCDFPVFSSYRIVGNKLYFDAWGVDVKTGEARRIDSYEIIKDPSIDTPKFNDRCRLSDLFKAAA